MCFFSNSSSIFDKFNFHLINSNLVVPFDSLVAGAPDDEYELIIRNKTTKKQAIVRSSTIFFLASKKVKKAFEKLLEDRWDLVYCGFGLSKRLSKAMAAVLTRESRSAATQNQSFEYKIKYVIPQSWRES